MRNHNRTAIRKLSAKSLKNSRVRNRFAVCAIVLTAMLFTAVFSLFGAMIQAGQESTMREVGGRFHAGLKEADLQQYEKAAADPLVKECNYNILLGMAENIRKRQTEIRMMPFEEALPQYFITLKEGNLPRAEDEIVVDTFVMNELGIAHQLGEKVPLEFQFMGETIKKEFSVSGYYEGDAVSHASELFVSETFWRQVKNGYTEADFREWQKKHPQDQGKGLLSVQLFFENASNLEEKVRMVIERAGYEPETELDYGVNWAYMQNRMESIDPFSFALLGGALAVILLTGYLIIYNIFQISIRNDIRFYGLLKTIGTTKKQLRRLIMRQVLLLSAIGIPIGLLLGYGVGYLGTPIVAKLSNSNLDLDLSLSPNPLIFLGGAAFSAATVFLSCRKPGKVAGSVSAVEAVKYTQASIKARAKKKRRSFTPLRMAIANMGRSKKNAMVVISAMTLSLILLTLVMTGVGSFQISQYLEQRIAGDFMIGGLDVFQHMSGNYIHLDQEFAAFADAQPGLEQTDELWIGYGMQILVDEKGRDGLRRLDQEGKLRRDEYTTEPMEMEIFGGYSFSYTDGLFKNIKVLEGSLDIEKFQSGDYILLKCFYGNDMLDAADSIYHPGDQVTVASFTKDSVAHEVKDDAGEVIDVVYEGLAEKKYEVMAIVDFPHSMDMSRYSPNGMDAVLPLKEMTDQNVVNAECFAKSYQVAEKDKAAFEEALKNYTEQVDATMGYASKQTLEQEFSGMIGAVSMIGVTLAVVIAFIGVLNFINAVFTGIISRKQEFAMLQSIGMTKGQLRSVVVCEGLSYVAAAGMISFAAGSLLAYAVLHALNDVIAFFEYRFQVLPFLIMLPVLMIVAVVAPMVSFEQLGKESVVERLRNAE